MVMIGTCKVKYLQFKYIVRHQMAVKDLKYLFSSNKIKHLNNVLKMMGNYKKISGFLENTNF